MIDGRRSVPRQASATTTATARAVPNSARNPRLLVELANVPNLVKCYRS